jgi:hypothetical protein
MATAEIIIDGDGIAALCCAHLLQRNSIPFSFEPHTTGKQPAILLGSQAVSLLKDVSQTGRLLDAGWQIERRVVQWGNAKEPLTIPHYAVSIAEETLMAGMRASLTHGLEDSRGMGDWRIVTRKPDSADAFDVYGRRQAISQRVALKRREDSRSCWAESTPHGWLFLLPFSENEASLITAGYEPKRVIEESRLIVPRLSSEWPLTRAVSIAPKIARMLHQDKTILTGSAAMRFDPLCGEGAGHAVREAYLTVAVIRAALRGEAVDDLLNHYTNRLRQAFLRHLIVCSLFYSSGGDSDFWRDEQELLQRGIRELRAQIEGSAPVQFRFSGLDLEAITSHLVP